MTREKINPKELLEKIIRQEGVSGLAKEFADILKEKEEVVRNSNDKILAQGFEVVFLTIMDCYDDAHPDKKKWIEQVFGTDMVQDALKVINWSSKSHCPAMQEAYKKLTNKDTDPLKVGTRYNVFHTGSGESEGECMAVGAGEGKYSLVWTDTGRELYGPVSKELFNKESFSKDIYWILKKI